MRKTPESVLEKIEEAKRRNLALPRYLRQKKDRG